MTHHTHSVVAGLERVHGVPYRVERYWIGGRGYRYFYVADVEDPSGWPAYDVEDVSGSVEAFLLELASHDVNLEFPHKVTPRRLEEAERFWKQHQFTNKEVA